VLSAEASGWLDKNKSPQLCKRTHSSLAIDDDQVLVDFFVVGHDAAFPKKNRLIQRASFV